MKTPLTIPENVNQTAGLEEPGYFVFVEGQRGPTKVHPNRFLARKEALRLADNLPGRTVHVCKVKETFVNALPLPDNIQADRDARLAANSAKQVAARVGWGPGMPVSVKSSHHMFAGELGYIERLGELPDDTSVYVKLVSQTGATTRFSPTSLSLTMPSDAKAAASARREPRCGDLIHYVERGVERQGEIKEVLTVHKKFSEPSQGYLIRDIIDNLLMPRVYSREEFVVDIFVEDRPEGVSKACDGAQPRKDTGGARDALIDLIATIAMSGLARRFGLDKSEELPGGALPIGTEVYALVDKNVLFGAAIKGKVTAYKNDTIALVAFENRDGSMDEPTEVPVNALIRVDDPRIHTLAV